MFLCGVRKKKSIFVIIIKKWYSIKGYKSEQVESDKILSISNLNLWMAYLFGRLGDEL